MKHSSFFSLLSLFTFLFAMSAMSQENNHATPPMDRLKGYFPEEVKTIAIITPGSSPSVESVMQSVRLLEASGYKVKIMPNALMRPDPDDRIVEPWDTFLVDNPPYIPYYKNSLPVKYRLADFYRAWEDPEVDMILCARGGFGCRDLIINLDWERLAKRNSMRLMGFSDCTLLGLVFAARGVGHPILGPCATSLAGLPKENIDYSADMLNGRETKPIELRAIIPGNFEGLPLAGVLSRYAFVAGTNYQPDGHGRVFFLENVGEGYEVSLEECYEKHFFDGAAGIILCHFLENSDPERLEKYIKSLGERVGCPVYTGFEFGHARNNNAIDLTRKCIVKDGVLTFPAVK